MNGKLIVGLGLTGALPPLLTHALGITSTAIVLALWTVLAAALWIPLVLRAKTGSTFVTLLLVGVVAGVAAGIVDVVATRDPMLFVMALMIGAFWGALFGGIAMGVDRMRLSREGARA